MQKSEKTDRFSCTFLISVFFAILLILADTCLADKGGWHISTEPVTLTESGQRAITGWGGETEILCLATDVSSSKKTTIIEFLPLPSEPNVTLGDRQAFETVEKVLAEHYVRFFKRRGGFSKGLRAGGDGGEPFRITFHERLGAHDVTVVKVKRPDEFADWIQEKARALTGGQVSLPDSIRELIAKYLNEYNCPYFVFDVIDVGPNPQSVEPIIYEFKSSEVFYPLEISSTFHGQTTIDLVIFSRYLIDQKDLFLRGFLLSNFVEVNASEMQKVLPRLNQLLGKTAFLQAFRYTGRIGRLRGNITAGPNREQFALSLAEDRAGKRRSFYQGIILGVIPGMIGGVLIAYISLWPMYFAAKRQNPRWGIRLLAGFFLGIPLASGLIFQGTYILRKLTMPKYLLQTPASMIFVIFSAGMGFIIFCFQLGLRRRWYLWWLVYAALAIPATFITDPNRIKDFFEGVPLIRLWIEMKYIFYAYIIVFIALFLIARLLIWITGSRKRPRSSLGR